MNEYRIEHDSLGEVRVPVSHLWGAQTQRSYDNFPVGWEKMPEEIIRAFALLKKAACEANRELSPEKMTQSKTLAISTACDEILRGRHDGEFPLSVWQTGSGTQTNMNLNEVIAHRSNELLQNHAVHPNDDVNMSQSSNDTFPTAMHIASALILEKELLPALENMISTLYRLEAENEGIVKSGRTHLQDAVPISFSQEISGWRGMMESAKAQIEKSLEGLYALAIGGTAVGTGLNAPPSFGDKVAEKLKGYTSLPFYSAENKFHALSSLDRMVFAHAALKSLAADMMKMANDIRWLASGPRCGLSEIFIPENEPGSSIMPGKVNPTQCESVTMVALRVIGNDTSISIAASQGNFELNVFLPLTAYSFLQSARLLCDSLLSFEKRCVRGIKANREKMNENLHRSLMLVTALSPHIGYENAAAVAKKAYKENITLKEACLKLGYMSEEKFDEIFHPEELI